MQLGQVVSALEKIAPLQLAAEWDNVGLLLEPAPNAEVRRVLLTVDLTAAVLQEAQTLRCDLIVAYHPPIFSGLKRLTQSQAMERTVLGVLGAGIAVYSPHTALDAVAGGLNDWLADGLGRGERVALQSAPASAGKGKSVALGQSVQGQGRLVRLARPVPLSALLPRIKRHLGLSRLRVAIDSDGKHKLIATVALCAGAGASVLAEASADLFLTGEMRHHDVLAAVQRKTAVVLTEHSNSERGYLPSLARKLRGQLGRKVEIRVARKDYEPLAIL
jgi:dinuclear metal center YbgI/SA1388 family protein